MKKVLLVGMLLLPTAQAEAWEYGFLTDSAGTSSLMGWTEPTREAWSNQGSSAEISGQLGCKSEATSHATDFPLYALWACLGAQGWEYVGKENLFPALPEDITYIFKRRAK